MKVTELFEDRYFNQWAKDKAAENRARNKLYAPPKPSKPVKQPKPTIDLWKVWQVVQDVVGNMVPDGDPIDELPQRLRRLGVPDNKIMDTLHKAVKTHYDKKSDYHKYLEDMWDSYNEMVDDDQKRDNPWR
jgi:hypothetical protein